MTRPTTMRDLYRAQKAREFTTPISPSASAMPAVFAGFADLDAGDCMHAFLRANAVRDRIGADLLKLSSTSHGAAALVGMLLTARSPNFWLQLDIPDPYVAFHRLTELRAVAAQAACVTRRH